MSHLWIRGGKTLEGSVEASGSKNAALPIIAASLLVQGKVSLSRIPDLTDIRVICEMIDALGAKSSYNAAEHTLEIDASGVSGVEAPYELVEKMRASFLVLGPLVARFGEARVPLPGGCRIGVRSVDSHLTALKGLGVEIEQDKGLIVAKGKPASGELYLEMPSVGATENAIMAAVLSEGKTKVYNCAMEPEIYDLAGFLSACGARISGAGTREIEIEGVRSLHSADYTIIPDRIEAGALLIAGAATAGKVTVAGAEPEHLTALTDKLIEIGCNVVLTKDSISVDAPEKIAPTSVRTLVYPGFPTDLQPQMMTLLTRASGVSIVTETLYENRFTHVAELNRMGARIKTRGNTAIVEPMEGSLSGAPVKAYDIRGGAAMVIAGLMASGETTITGVGFIDRGHEHIERKLAMLGAEIERRDGDMYLESGEENGA
ncbi:MAG: UDP-N-acetylglucosamine 1-carboxyvinyltransferase [bacterium]